MLSSLLRREWTRPLQRIVAAIDRRSARRCTELLLAAIVANGRHTVTNWIRAAQLGDDFRACYNTLAAVGTRTKPIAARLTHELIEPLLADTDRITLALDDTPTERAGPHVQGAAIHHNPTPGPAGSEFLYGHVWVVLAALVTHPIRGVIALPLLAKLYLRDKTLASLPEDERPTFRTKLELAVELVRWATIQFKHLRKPLWVVADGAYAKADVLKPLSELGVTVVSRLRHDAALRTLPQSRTGQRGRPRIYGEHRIELAKRAGQRRGWVRTTLNLYGKSQVKRYKTFLATWSCAGGAIRVVLVDEPTGWVAFFSTDVNATVADILELVSARFSIETCFRDVKEIVGAGQQQVRKLSTNVGSFHVCLWAYVLTEAWAWKRACRDLVSHRVASPWDSGARRPSHTDKRRAFRLEILGETIRAAVPAGTDEGKIATLTAHLLTLAA